MSELPVAKPGVQRRTAKLVKDSDIDMELAKEHVSDMRASSSVFDHFKESDANSYSIKSTQCMDLKLEPEEVIGSKNDLKSSATQPPPPSYPNISMPPLVHRPPSMAHIGNAKIITIYVTFI